jgi:ubiquinol-cytochrome c reductase cytochrome c subunit
MDQKMSMFGVRLGLAALAAGLALGSPAALAAGSPDKGKANFTKYGCYQCHGFVGQGSVATSNGKVIYNTALPLEAFVSFVRTTNRAMPPYSEKVLPNQDLEDIYAYLESLPKPPDYKTIPLLNQ